jgi:hypothetical protein
MHCTHDSSHANKSRIRISMLRVSGNTSPTLRARAITCFFRLFQPVIRVGSITALDRSIYWETRATSLPSSGLGSSFSCRIPLPLLMRMHPMIMRDLLPFRQLHHMHRRRMAAVPACSAFWCGFQLRDRRIARMASSGRLAWVLQRLQATSSQQGPPLRHCRIVDDGCAARHNPLCAATALAPRRGRPREPACDARRISRVSRS